MSTSIFDYLQPTPDPGGLSGLALALERQGGQPRGLRQGLGAGLLGLSGFAQEALPTAIQGGFGPGALAGFLGGLGAPARRAAAGEEMRGRERRQVQLSFLEATFPKLSAKGKTEVLRRLGVDVELGEEPGEPSLALKEMIQSFGSIMADENQPAETRRQAFQTLSGLAPEVGNALSGISFFDPSPDTIEATASTLYDNNTTESVNRFFDSSDEEHYGRFDRLVPKPEKERAGRGATVSQQLEMQAVSDYATLQENAQRNGTTIDEEADKYFSGDKPGRANFEKAFGITAGSAPPSELELLLRTSDIISRMGFAARMKSAEELFPEAKRFLKMTEEEAKRRAGVRGTIALPGEKAGARHPAGIAPPFVPPSPEVPVTAPPTAGPPAALAPQAIAVPEALTQGPISPQRVRELKALYRAGTAIGLDLTGVENWTELRAKLTTLPAEQRQLLINLARELEEETTPAD